MSEPTTYDVIQDTRIKGVEDLVQTTYTPFQGPEFSYPVVHQPMDDEMWQTVTLGVGSGLLDVGGRPYWLRDLSDVTDTGRLTVSTTTGTAQAILRGFYHRLNQDMTLNFPPVSRKTVYQVVLEYDPLRHKEPGGPIRVRVLTSLDWSGGKHYLPLWDLERDPSQLLSQAKVTQRRPKITPTITVDRWENRPPEHTQLWGTRLFLSHGEQRGREYIAWGADEATGGPTRWEDITNPGWTNISLSGGITQGATPASYRFTGGALEFQGFISRSSAFPTSSATVIGWVSNATLPPFVTVVAGNNGKQANLRSTEGSGGLNTLTVDTPESGTNRIWLDGVRIPVE